MRNKQQFLDCVTLARFRADGAEKDNIGTENHAMNCSGENDNSGGVRGMLQPLSRAKQKREMSTFCCCLHPAQLLTCAVNVGKRPSGEGWPISRRDPDPFASFLRRATNTLYMIKAQSLRLHRHSPTCSEMSSTLRPCGEQPCRLVKKGKRGAFKQKAATVLPDRTAATLYIYSSLSSFEFDIVGYGAPHDGKVPRVGCTHVGLSQKLGDT